MKKRVMCSYRPESRTLQLCEFTQRQIFEGGFMSEISPRVTESIEINNTVVKSILKFDQKQTLITVVL